MRFRTVMIGLLAVPLIAVGGVLSISVASLPTSMVGVVVARGGASLEVPKQIGIRGTLLVDNIVAPDDSWVVVYLADGNTMASGNVMNNEDSRTEVAVMPIGYVHVPPESSSGVRVPLTSGTVSTENVRVVLQADRGIRGKFEFNPLRFENSPDKPYYVEGTEVSVIVRVRFSEMENSFIP